MNVRYNILAILCTFLLISVSCKDKNETPPGGGGGGGGDGDDENQAINEWIYKDMKHYYYWNEQIPDGTSVDFKDKPDEFFYSLLYNYNELGGDRFSYLENNGVYQANDPYSDNYTPKKDIGFEYQAFSSGTRISGLCVTYVKGGSKAEEDGLKRGDWILTVDGEEPSMDKTKATHYSSILEQGKDSYELVLEGKGKFTLQTTSDFLEHPVLMSKMFDEGRIGYIVYNFFENGPTKYSYEYAQRVNEVLTEMTDVDYLILDLRYNGGGLVRSGAYIASALVPDRGGIDGQLNIYTKRAFNRIYDASIKDDKTYQKRITEYFHNKIEYVSNEIPRLNLTTLYIITSSQTASASEQIINGLSAYMKYGVNLKVIGETTVGKNMESFSIEDEKNKDHKWVLHPLTSVSYNADPLVNGPEDNDYSKGIPPTIGWVRQERNPNTGKVEMKFGYENDEFQTLWDEGTLYPLGDIRETLLSKALEDIGMVTPDQTPSLRTKRSTTTGTPMRIAGSSLDRKPKEMIIDLKE